MSTEPLLTLEALRVEYATANGSVTALDGVSLDVHAGEMLGLAGESGSGKSTLAHAILRTLRPPAVITGGHVWFAGHDVLSFDLPRLTRFRWKEVSMVFQSAMNSLNPVLTIGAQIVDVILAHRDDLPGSPSRSTATNRASELLTMVGIDPVHLASYPHQLSGGMRQRVGIALALALEPRLLILDEPTTALDVVVQASLVRKLSELRAQLGFAVLFITHDLPLLFECTDRIAILYGGRLAELGPAERVRDQPFHPYTAGLLRSSPSLDGPRRELFGIDGAPPRLDRLPSGCYFHPRCHAASEQCRAMAPALLALGDGSNRRAVACHHPENAT